MIRIGVALFLCAFVSLALAGIRCGGDSSNDKTCTDAVNNLWKIFSSAERSAVCDKLVVLDSQPGVDISADDSGTPFNYTTCSTPEGNGYQWDPSETLFKTGFMSWCNGSTGDKWSQATIDCNANAKSIADLPCK